MDELDIIKAGVVSLHVKNFLKASWVKKFCVLYQATADSHAFIEVYEDQKSFNEYRARQKHNDIKKIELRNVSSVRHLMESNIKGSEYIIEIRCKNQKHVLMLNNEQDSNEWMSVLKNFLPSVANNEESSHNAEIESYNECESEDVVTINETYGTLDKVQKFTVDVQYSDLANLCGIVGKMTMLMRSCNFEFEDFETRKILCNFHVTWMRRFGAKKSQFHFEVGRKCPNGEGTILCNTDFAKQIHQIVQDMSQSSKSFQSQNSIKEVKASNNSTQSPTDFELPSLLAPQSRNQETSSSVGISAPISAPSILRKHPGHIKTPSLVPIKPASQDNDASVLLHSTTKEPSKHVGLHDSKELDDQGELEIGIRSVSKFVHDDFAKELEGIVQSTDVNKKNTLRVSGSKKEKERDKIEKGTSKKKDKGDKKEKEKREKEEKKERERLEKEKKQKDKKKSLFIKDKKLSKGSVYRADSHPHSEAGAELCQLGNSAYAECGDVLNALEPVVDYARQCVNHDVGDDGLYDEAMSVVKSNDPIQSPNHVEYAEPVCRTGGVRMSGDKMVYTDVAIGKTWKDYARKEEDEHHEENYSNLQAARRQMIDNPPIPERQYIDGDDDNDDTYDRATLKYPENKEKHVSKPEVKNENVYGLAGGKKIALAIDLPTAPYSHDSTDCDSEEYIEEAENAYEGYAVPEAVKANSLRRILPVQSYEDTDIKVKPRLPPKPSSPTVKALKKTFYEEVE